mmetsp:Transcript_1099/g.3058  ORF Transcript_1099/g.3058 Transcript_1099/m.3058 type:complete len:928 (+) Transcript_1099:706-3489(+)
MSGLVRRGRMSPSASCGSVQAAARLVGGGPAGLDVPDVLGVLADGAVGRELARAGRVHDGAARPLRLVLVAAVHLGLRVQVAGKVVGQQEPVVADLHVVHAVHQGLEVLLVAKHAALDVRHQLVPAGVRLERLAVLAQLVDLLGLDAKDEALLHARLLRDLDVGAVPGADDEAAVHLELHVGGARRLGAGSGDVLRQLRAGDDGLGERDVVVGQEVQAQVVLGVGVVVDLLAHRVDQADDALGHVVRGRGLAADDAHARHRLLALRGAHRLELLVAVDDGQHVEVLALVLVDALDLDVEQRVHVDVLAVHALDELRELGLLLALDRRPLGLERLVGRVLAQLLQALHVVDPAVADGVGDEGRQLGVAPRQPAAGCHAVGLVLELGGEDLVEVVQDLVLHDLRVDGGHAVDVRAAHHGQVRHVDQPLVLVPGVGVDDGHGLHLGGVLGVGLEPLGPAVVDDLNDLHVAGQHLAHDLDGPLLQRLGHDGVVGVVEALGDDAPRVVPGQALHVHQQAGQLRHRNGGVRVVQLEARLLGQQVPLRAVLGLEAGHHVLQRGGHEEVLLLQAQLLALVRAVVGVQHGRQRLGALLGQDGGHVVAGVERLQVKLLGGLGRPQPQVDAVARAKPGDGVVVRDRGHLLAGVPLEHLAAVNGLGGHVAVELDGVRHDQALNLPRVAEREPVVGLLVLEAVEDVLLEHAVLVADAVAPGGQVERGHGVQEAGRQAAQAAVAQRGVALLLADRLQVVAHLAQRLSVRLSHVQVVQRVEQRAAHEEFHGQVVHALGVLLLEVGLGVVPGLHQAVAQAQGGGLVALKVIKAVARARHGVLHVTNDALLDAEHIILLVGVHERRYAPLASCSAKLGARCTPKAALVTQHRLDSLLDGIDLGSLSDLGTTAGHEKLVRDIRIVSVDGCLPHVHGKVAENARNG